MIGKKDKLHLNQNIFLHFLFSLFDVNFLNESPAEWSRADQVSDILAVSNIFVVPVSNTCCDWYLYHKYNLTYDVTIASHKWQ